LQPLQIPEWKWEMITMDCVRISQREEREWCNMGYHRPFDKICTIPAYKDDRFSRQACQDLHKQGDTAPQDFDIHYLGSGS
jgi:hypothetical protein